MNEQRILILHAQTPLHVGTGRGEGLIDLPVARDAVTKHPIVPGSGIKGPLRAAASAGEREDVFGPDPTQAHLWASAVRFSDARLIAMPVASDFGTFAWVTSPLVLARWIRDAGGIIDFPATPRAPEGEIVACMTGSPLRHKGKVTLDGQTYKASELAPAWAEHIAGLAFPGDPVWQGLLRERLVVAPDGVFDNLCRTGTDVRAHIRIDPDTGTVQDGALWYEESVPAEAIFAGVVQIVGNGRRDAHAAEAELRRLLDGPVALGGGKTTGMGVVRVHLHGGRP